jgi:hypothetical protein
MLISPASLPSSLNPVAKVWVSGSIPISPRWEALSWSSPSAMLSVAVAPLQKFSPTGLNQSHAAMFMSDAA